MNYSKMCHLEALFLLLWLFTLKSVVHSGYIRATPPPPPTTDPFKIRIRATPHPTTDPLVIHTTTGFVRGERVKSVTGKTVDQFLGIRYAEPPIGKLRFRHPRPIEPWAGIFNATSAPNSCYQINDTTFGELFPGTVQWNANTKLSEDCLNLNIWVPYPRPREPVAVLVWIFGGGFWYGTTGLDLYDGRTITAEENIILVSINYRVSNLGFLYFEEAFQEAPGNAGMFDQIMALQWIQANIDRFGGNKDKVTLFGESAGAVSVGYHLLSPLSRNLFSQAILQSGGPTVPWGISDKHKISQRGLLVAEAIGCPHDPAQMAAVMECLRKADPWALVTNATNENMGVVEFAFTPIVDGVFLDETPENLLESKEFKKTKLLLGSNADEGNAFIIYYLTELFKNSEDIFVNRADFEKSVKELTPNMPRLAQEAIIYEYTHWQDPDDPIQNRNAIDKMVGDYHFTCHVNRIANKYAATGNEVFMYYFGHRSSQNAWPKWMGVMHGDEIGYIFGEPLKPQFAYTRDEILLSRKMMNCWANFAKSGNPTLNERGEWSQVLWPLYSSNKKEYLTFAVNSTRIDQGPRAEQCAFWRKYLPQIVKETARLEDKSVACEQQSSQAANIHGANNFLLLTLAILAIALLKIRCILMK